ncbi:skin secretory protein xP2-like [Pipra filicauda]|uniref:Skin secretory protein xP2-like n=1 Tax=Pipra filicauda TaxID=649802 RepID=A0A6J2FYP2_9PASS|nr:skin secretory protein xP2-like [Pipra filicauda]
MATPARRPLPPGPRPQRPRAARRPRRPPQPAQPVPQFPPPPGGWEGTPRAVTGHGRGEYPGRDAGAASATAGEDSRPRDRLPAEGSVRLAKPGRAAARCEPDGGAGSAALPCVTGGWRLAPPPPPATGPAAGPASAPATGPAPVPPPAAGPASAPVPPSPLATGPTPAPSPPPAPASAPAPPPAPPPSPPPPSCVRFTDFREKPNPASRRESRPGKEIPGSLGGWAGFGVVPDDFPAPTDSWQGKIWGVLSTGPPRKVAWDISPRWQPEVFLTESETSGSASQRDKPCVDMAEPGSWAGRDSHPGGARETPLA